MRGYVVVKGKLSGRKDHDKGELVLEKNLAACL